MMNITEIISRGVQEAVKAVYGSEANPKSIAINPTHPDFEGDYTVIVFPFSKIAKKKPEDIGHDLGAHIVENLDEISAYNVVKGFLNLSISNAFWANVLEDIYKDEQYGLTERKGEKVMVEFSSPNTNKPLHLGHIRNILLGWSTYKILDAAGYDVIRTQIVNDRGIAICKSMLAWEKFGNGETPESSGIKGDHLAGKYYVLFEQKFREEYAEWQLTDEAKTVFEENKAKFNHSDKKTEMDEATFFNKYKNTYFNKYSKIGSQAKEMLIKWEENDPDVRALWAKMNSWVYAGFDITYDKLGVAFDKLYYESETYLLAKKMVEEGLEKNVFYKKEDGSIWADFSNFKKLDDKVIMRADGTSLYITQDMGTAHLRYKDYGANKMVYVVADEQNDHFNRLFAILKKLEEPYADGLYHLSYGMVDLPEGKMKSREGTVVDADDLIREVKEEAWNNSKERDTLSELSKEAQQDVIRKIALGALKFFILKVNPQKRMVFNPKESVDLQGQTGPYVQNAYVRIQSILRKADMDGFDPAIAKDYKEMALAERELIATLDRFPKLILDAADNYDPSSIANYCYNLGKAYHKFYHDYSILGAENEAAKAFRIMLSISIGKVLKTGFDLLGIEMPERM